MELSVLDRLLISLIDQPRQVQMAMRAAGYTQEEISEAWTAARKAGYTQETGLGQDRLTAAGRARGQEAKRAAH